MTEELSKPSMSKISKDLGMELEEFGGGIAAIKVTVDQRHLNKGGVAFGGLHASMLDSAMGGALVSTLKVNEWCATANITINYLEASLPDVKLIATGRIVRRGRNLAHLFGEIRDNEGIVHANATGVWTIWKSKPEKFYVNKQI